MAENVFILGAGASKESGAPLMNNFLDVAEDLLRANAFKEGDKISKVFEVISKLQSVYAKSYLELTNIESLFGVIEMARVINKLDSYSLEEIKDIRESLVTLIVKTLEKTIVLPVENQNVTPPRSYRNFVELVNDKGIGDCSIITFNYDLALDYACHWMNTDVNYCLDKKASRSVKLLKLHGSINWARCTDCQEIIPFTLDKYFHRRSWNIIGGTKTALLNVSDNLQSLADYHEHKEFEKNPVIVPPTWNKTEYHGTLTNVWNQAAQELSEARNIYVFGYSLPESDSFFRYLFALGTIGDSRIRRFWVFDPDESGLIKTRYEQLLGRGILNRFDYIPEKFSGAISVLRRRIKE